MHDLLIEMGNEIVQRTFPKVPGKRSRFCMQQDICHVLEKHTVRPNYKNLFFIKMFKLHKCYFYLFMHVYGFSNFFHTFLYAFHFFFDECC